MADIFAEGREAYDAGLSETDNPYDVETEFDEHTLWNDGWAEGCAQAHQEEDEG